MDQVVELRYLGGHRLFLRFQSGASGEVNLADKLRFDGVFAPLKDPVSFADARVDPEWGSVNWPTGADLCPDVLRQWLSESRAAAE